MTQREIFSDLALEQQHDNMIKQMEETTKLEYTKILASFLGYKYFEPNVMVDCGDWNYKCYKPCNIFSKTPILLKIYPADIEFKESEERYFANVPNPDFGKTEGNKWRGDLHELSWASLNEYILDFDASNDWNLLIDIYSKFDDEQMNEDEYELWCVVDITIIESIRNNNPELVFKALAEYIKENKL